MRYRTVSFWLAALTASIALVDPPQVPGQGEGGVEAPPPGIEVQARGAVHEAYGEPTRSQAAPGPIVPKEPPRAIDEAPPEEKPEGDNMVWIPGYWSWDEDASKFLWISGFWRAVPPGRNWVPGTWQRAAGGFRWVSGYWGVASQGEETEYLPPPPESIDNGPSVPAPGENYTYVPGTWVYQTQRFVWRPGHWMGYRPGWVWVPACYRWTPCGYVFVPGYWDFPLLDRGLLFAPVAFTRPVYLTPGFVYRPAYCIQPDFLCGALFVRRGWGGYYFGDYFGSPYRSSFTAWTSFRFGGGVGVDLNFGYYRSAYRGFPAWERGLVGLYSGRFAGTIAPPPRTLVQQNTVINNIVVNKTTNNIVNKNVNITNIQNVTALTSVKNMKKVNVTAMSSLAGIPEGKAAPTSVSRQVRLDRLTPAQINQEKQQVARLNTLAQERRRTEDRLREKAPTTQTAAPLKARIDLPKGTPPARVVKTPTPPPMPGRHDSTNTTKPPVRPTVAGKPDGTPMNPVKPVTPSVKPVTPGKPTQPVKPLDTKPIPSKPEVKPTTPVNPATPGKPTRPMPPITPVPEVKPVRPMNPAPTLPPGKPPLNPTPTSPKVNPSPTPPMTNPPMEVKPKPVVPTPRPMGPATPGAGSRPMVVPTNPAPRPTPATTPNTPPKSAPVGRGERRR